MKQQVGVIGLAVMGRNLALNIAEHGFSVAVYNRSPQKTKELRKEAEKENLQDYVKDFYTLEDFIEALETPRKLILMVKAGAAVDDTIRQLLPLLSKGDLLMDGGNSYYLDTIRRCQELEQYGIHFLGTGISGGEEGARKGPAIMPGGKPEAYRLLEPVLTAISAKVEGEPCSAYIGENGAGHFVKMVHNGIEYADMQLIAESYQILKQAVGLTVPQLKEVYTEWNQGELNSYLIDITADIFAKKDTETDGYLLDYILDIAGQKGTGKWTGQISLELGVPTPTITAAVYERSLSAKKQERVNAAAVLSGPIPGQRNNELHNKNQNTKPYQAELIEKVRKALYASKICAYAQGFALLREASLQFGWDLTYQAIAKLFRGGCIIRAQFLNQISKAYEKNKELVNLLMEDYFKNSINDYQEAWREVVIMAITNGISVPAFSSALAYYDSYRTERLPMNLIQAQRDYFGAHTYERWDRKGIYHTNWEN
jgi:6-phosphogluconate dehydrogenase